MKLTTTDREDLVKAYGLVADARGQLSEGAPSFNTYEALDTALALLMSLRLRAVGDEYV